MQPGTSMAHSPTPPHLSSPTRQQETQKTSPDKNPNEIHRFTKKDIQIHASIDRSNSYMYVTLKEPKAILRPMNCIRCIAVLALVVIAIVIVVSGSFLYLNSQSNYSGKTRSINIGNLPLESLVAASLAD